MMRGRLLAAIAALLAGACVNFDETRQQYCKTVAPETRAEICLDGPQVLSFTPFRNATNVEFVRAQITVTFDQEVGCDPAGISLKQNEMPVAGTTSCSAMQAVFTPAADLFTGRVYKVTVTGSIKSKAEQIPALPLSWTFTTR